MGHGGPPPPTSGGPGPGQGGRSDAALWRLVAVVAVVALVVLVAVGTTLALRSGDDEGGEVAADGPADDRTEPEGSGGACATVEVDAADAPEVEVPDGRPPEELEVTDITEGDGPEAEPGDAVEVQYTGVALSTGEEFDTSWDDLSPLPFVLDTGAMIPGFDQGVVGMRVGGRRQLVIPPDLGYGEAGAGGAIGPDETLVFVVDLVRRCPAGAAPSDDDAAVDTTAPTDTTDPTGAVAPPGALPSGPDGRTLTGPTPCPAEDGSEERVAEFAEPPPTCTKPEERLTAEVVIDRLDAEGTATEAGTITIELDAAAAPTMVNNFVVLARYRFYDGIPFHRLVPDFVAQVGGSGAPGPDGTPDYGTTGPGYDMPDVEHPTDGYQVGDVAMARGAEVSGSQIFIVTSEAGLPALDQAGSYPRLGRVVAGLDLAVAMADSGDADTNGTPKVVYVIRSVTIRPT